MKKIGLIGGVSWKSTAQYYQIINEYITHKLGGNHSAKMVIESLDFGPLEACAHAGDWGAIEKTLVSAVRNLEKAGADFFLICANTLHKLEKSICKKTGMPFLSIVSETLKEVTLKKIKKVGLLGTKFTMESAFFKEALSRNGVACLTPPEADRMKIHKIIYDELVKGILQESSRAVYLKIIQELEEKGCEGIILGCTEIPLLIQQADVKSIVLDTTKIHAIAAAQRSIEEP
ncbi:MAG: amino acid racemase [Deltaproteobacteria bacterium]|nr:amino acid racemase [Deltaproteobacteria bacterium]